MEFNVNSIEETTKLGYEIGKLLNPGNIICLTGDLGTGKTHITKGIAKGLNINDIITSPTFNNLRLSNVKTNNILKENGLNWPDITDDYINKIIDYLIRNGLMVI